MSEGYVGRTRMRFHNERDEHLWAAIRNLPSDQIARVFDHYFELMLEPISLYTNVIYEGIAEALVLLTNQRRKITLQNRERVVAALFAAMNADRETVPRRLLSLGIERNILTDMVYTALHDDDVYLPGVEPEPLRRHLNLLMTDLQLFRDVVLNRYIPLITKRSAGFAWEREQRGLRVEKEDAYQNYYMAAIRALDRFDVNTGTLTGYLSKWLQSASHSIFNLHIGESYSVTRGARAKIYSGEADLNNHAVPLEGNPAVEAVVDELPDAFDAEIITTIGSVTALLRATNRIEPYRFALLAVKANCELTPAELAAQRATLECPL